MAAAHSAATTKKKGLPRLPLGGLKPDSKRVRRHRNSLPARDRIPNAHEESPHVGQRRGRPRMPYRALSAEGRRKRAYRARLPAKLPRQQILLSALIDVAAQQRHAVDPEEAALQEAERARQRRMRALERQLAGRDPSTDGPQALVLRQAAPRVEGERSCMVCLQTNDECASEPRPMRCCGQLICAPCLADWLQQSGTRERVGYGEGANGMSGREVLSDPLDAHRCPACRCACHSVMRGLGAL